MPLGRGRETSDSEALNDLRRAAEPRHREHKERLVWMLGSPASLMELEIVPGFAQRIWPCEAGRCKAELLREEHLERSGRKCGAVETRSRYKRLSPRLLNAAFPEENLATLLVGYDALDDTTRGVQPPAQVLQSSLLPQLESPHPVLPGRA
eukprot:CAMPEP_0170643650 /NCGR_PEP_ID=MMETSP0224-20130122/42011_1 /TAXON_ID=285029 /ORGANISM="Togula jolla, Strain CCCM 725" /LENGTH=150 /DNA_ID=CAMNT_0010974517 /DNA_START=231 /DNA_END=682 /DNA_ORIENTATION=-